MTFLLNQTDALFLSGAWTTDLSQDRKFLSAALVISFFIEYTETSRGVLFSWPFG